MKSKKNKKQNTEAKQHSVPHHCLSLERRTYLFERYGLTSLLDGTPEPQPLPQETTEVEIPWDYVTFHDGYACIFHPKYYNEIGKPYIRINGNKIKRSFNRVSELFIKRLPNIVVKCCGRKMLSIVKLPEFWECITILDQPSLIPDFILTAGVPPKKLRGISRDLLGRLIQKDLEYVRYLCSRQLCNHKAYYILERRINSSEVLTNEEGFVFIVRKLGATIKVVYENSLPARASIIFDVKADKFELAIAFIHQFFSSNTINKRELLHRHRVDASNHGIMSYFHVNHTTYYEWQTNLLKKLE